MVQNPFISLAYKKRSEFALLFNSLKTVESPSQGRLRSRISHSITPKLRHLTLEGITKRYTTQHPPVNIQFHPQFRCWVIICRISLMCYVEYRSRWSVIATADIMGCRGHAFHLRKPKICDLINKTTTHLMAEESESYAGSGMQQRVEISAGHEFQQESVMPRRFANTHQLNDVRMILNLKKNSSFLSETLDFAIIEAGVTRVLTLLAHCFQFRFDRANVLFLQSSARAILSKKNFSCHFLTGGHHFRFVDFRKTATAEVVLFGVFVIHKVVSTK